MGESQRSNGSSGTGAVAAGHELAARAGAQMLADGGNAADAACAMGFALQVLEPTQNGPGGEVPILVWDAREDRAFCISGQGPAPQAASVDAYRALGIDRIPPDGLLAATVPAAIDAWCLLLERFGTLRLEDVLAPARELATRGFPMYPFLHGLLTLVEPRLREWPATAEVWVPVPAVGETQRNASLARFYSELVEAERAAAGSRDTGIRAARDHFYRGPVAERIETFLREPVLDATGEAHAGWLTADDLARYQGSIEEPVKGSYRGADVWKCPPWSQGPVFLQQLALLEGFDVAGMGRGSADFLHTWIEAAKLAFADRDACYADPRFAEVPLARLLSKEYADERRGRIDPGRASLEFEPGVGSLPEGWPWEAGRRPGAAAEPQAWAAASGRSDTTQCVAADAQGNLVSATPSGGWLMTSPAIPGLGFPVGTRAQMFTLDPRHPNRVEPGKRPRTTLSPSLARLPDGRRMAFGTPGGDQQDQWTHQFFLELVDFGTAGLQAAIDAPTVHSLHMPSSFFPRMSQPGAVAAEDRLGEATLAELERRGHRIVRSGPWHHGRVMAVRAGSGGPEAAASTRFGVAAAIALS